MKVSLQELESGWFDYEPAGKRPLGGRRALMGFNYQFSISLNQFIDKVLKEDPDAAIAFEGLSDLAELRGDLIYLTQVKTTLTTDKLKDAIREFLMVDKFLEDEHGTLQPRFRYQVICKKTKGNVRQDLSATDLKLDASEAARWARVRTQVLPYTVQGDPSLELVIKLWKKVSRPFDFVAALRGDLLRLLAANEPSDKIGEVLLKRWQDNRTEDAAPGVLLSPSDFHDQSQEKTHVLVGQRPSLDDLNEGCFMEREALVQKIIEALGPAMSYGAEVRAGRKIPVVWIGGGSGVGKSALLLQTLRKFVMDYDTPVNFLQHFPDQLPEALTYWGQQKRSAVIAVDDLYAPDYRQDQLWSEVNRLAYEAPYVTLLTCGPNDYRNAFEQQARRQGVMQVIPVDISPLDAQELESYRAWYSVRAQQEDVKPVTETNFVVAAFLLERRRQGDVDIGDFAARLRQRLDQLGLTDNFLAALAVNRLGIEAPMTLFDGKRDAIGQLVKDGLCQLRETPEQQDIVLWFHRALAHTIYNIFVSQDAIETRALHIKHFFTATLDDPDRAKAFIQLLGKGKHPQLSKELIKEILKKLWDGFKQQQPPELNAGLVFEWRNAVQNRGLAVERIVQTSRIRAWMTSQEIPPWGWGLLWQILWDDLLPQKRDDLAAEAKEWLISYPDLPGWNFVWQKLWMYEEGDKFLKECANEWLDDHPDSRGWSFVFQALYDAGIREDWMLNRGMDGLANSPVTVADRYIWSKVESLEPAPDAFLYNLTQRLCKSLIQHIQAEGVELIKSRLPDVGIEPVLEALDQNQDEPGWNYVYRRLLDELPRDETLLQQGREWLDGHQNRPEYRYVKRKLDKYNAS